MQKVLITQHQIGSRYHDYNNTSSFLLIMLQCFRSTFIYHSPLSSIHGNQPIVPKKHFWSWDSTRHVRACMHTHTHIQICSFARLHTHTDTPTHSYKRTQTHVYTHNLPKMSYIHTTPMSKTGKTTKID